MPEEALPGQREDGARLAGPAAAAPRAPAGPASPPLLLASLPLCGLRHLGGPAEPGVALAPAPGSGAQCPALHGCLEAQGQGTRLAGEGHGSGGSSVSAGRSLSWAGAPGPDPALPPRLRENRYSCLSFPFSEMGMLRKTPASESGEGELGNAQAPPAPGVAAAARGHVCWVAGRKVSLLTLYR